jgi:hypothetical protein
MIAYKLSQWMQLLFFIIVLISQSIRARPVEIDEDNWEGLLSQGEWMVEL